MKAIALCNFQHKGVDYEKNQIIFTLGEKDVTALAKIGLVMPEAKSDVEAEMPQKRARKKNEATE